MNTARLRFRGTVAAASTLYVPIPIPMTGRITIDLAWKDATSSAAVTFETTMFDSVEAPVEVAGDAWEWKAEAGVPITGPAAAAAGSTKVHLSNLGDGVRARLKIVAAANSDLEIYSS